MILLDGLAYTLIGSRVSVWFGTSDSIYHIEQVSEARHLGVVISGKFAFHAY